MATNWPPIMNGSPWSPWPPVEIPASSVTGATLKDLASCLLKHYGFSWRNATPQELNLNNGFLKGTQCDEGHNCNVVVLVSPQGRLYCVAYCNAAQHRSVLVPYIVGYDDLGQPVYDAGNGSGVWP